MSMLAEPRRKQKWSIDPRNSAWSKDDSKFGQKMLERMGWSKGKGLGRSQQGSTEHIKVKVKNNNLGLGTTASYEDNWIAHQDDFNQLLADLNNCHSQTNEKKAPSEEQKSFSLEEKSKTSRKRVHYMKFTKGKDLSCRSKTDLNCIFGKRAKHANGTLKEEENNGHESQGEKEVKLEVKEEAQEQAISAGPQPDLDVEGITRTVTSTLTMQEYFAQRMALLKRSRGQDRGRGRDRDPLQSSASVVAAETSDLDHAGIGPPPYNPVANTDGNSDEERKKKRKKSKKDKRVPAVEVEEEEDEAAAAVEEEEEKEVVGDAEQEPVCQEKTKKKKKKKKSKRQAAEVEGAEEVEASLGPGGEAAEEKPSKRSRRTDELCVEAHLDEMVESGGTSPKKKKRKHGETQTQGEAAKEEMAEVRQRKSKKGKKKCK